MKHLCKTRMSPYPTISHISCHAVCPKSPVSHCANESTPVKSREIWTLLTIVHSHRNRTPNIAILTSNMFVLRTLDAAVMKSPISKVKPGKPKKKKQGGQCLITVFKTSWKGGKVYIFELVKARLVTNTKNFSNWQQCHYSIPMQWFQTWIIKGFFLLLLA